jgi:hypothetical protein
MLWPAPKRLTQPGTELIFVPDLPCLHRHPAYLRSRYLAFPQFAFRIQALLARFLQFLVM